MLCDSATWSYEESSMHETITVLTVDLPPKLAERLRLANQKRPPGSTLRDIALEALEEWLERRGG